MQLSSWVLFRVLPNSSTMALNTCAYQRGSQRCWLLIAEVQLRCQHVTTREAAAEGSQHGMAAGKSPAPCHVGDCTAQGRCSTLHLPPEQ